MKKQDFFESNSCKKFVLDVYSFKKVSQRLGMEFKLLLMKDHGWFL
jgi:hypothetical protein